MRLILTIATLVIAVHSTFAQDNAATKKAKEDILKLHNDWNAARVTKDINAIEQIFAKEYVFIHGNGFMDDRATAIDDQINTDSIQALSIPEADDITVYTDMAVLKRLIKNPEGSNFNTIIYVKRNGRWQIALHQTTPLQPERRYKKLAPNELQKYTGKYTMNSQTAIVSKENDTLTVKIIRIPKRILLPTADNLFYDKVGTQYKFVKNVTGAVTQLIIKPESGLEEQWKKID